MSTKKILSLIFTFCFLLGMNIGQAQIADELSIVPYPKKLIRTSGTYQLQSFNYYVQDTTLFKNEADYLKSLLYEVTGNQLKKAPAASAEIQLLKNSSLPQDTYTLQITKKGLVLAASTGIGMFSALQTLRQLLPAAISKSTVLLPMVSIEDQPAFEWRGIELDLARHMFSKNYIFKFIDLLSLYKFNKLQFHLTDDQGWRLEIKKYPKLTEQGAWRKLNNHDSTCMEIAKDNPDFRLDPAYLRVSNGELQYGGYYTQADMKEIINYAASKHIEIIPEIEMPGHMRKAAEAYPFLLDQTGAGWGKTSTVAICPCKPETYTFVEDVLDEVIALFPSKYIHIGADEVEKSSWASSKLCQDMMKKEGLTSLEAVHNFFVNRVNQHIKSKGKTTVAWDEVLDGGFTDNSINVMYWRGWVKDGPLRAVTNNHPLIMTPTDQMYFDYQPDKTTLANVYNMNVIHKDIPNDKFALVKGAQANIWTEMICSEDRLEYMILPRMAALAERVWTNSSSFSKFEKRANSQYERWDAMGLNYRLPDLKGFSNESVIIDSTLFQPQGAMASSTIYYTLDGSEPSKRSKALHAPMVIKQPTRIRFVNITDNDHEGEFHEVNFKKGEWYSAGKTEKTFKAGLNVSLYKGKFGKVEAIAGKPFQTLTQDNISLPENIEVSPFGAQMKGYIKVPERGIYSFYLNCDDGAVLKINGETVVNNDKSRRLIEESGQIALEAGSYPFDVGLTDTNKYYKVTLQYSVNASELQPVPNSWFFH